LSRDAARALARIANPTLSAELSREQFHFRAQMTAVKFQRRKSEKFQPRKSEKF
jgi:hypothetical protein